MIKHFTCTECLAHIRIVSKHDDDSESVICYNCGNLQMDENIQMDEKRRVFLEYAQKLQDIYVQRTAGDYTWQGLLYSFWLDIQNADND